MQSDAICEHGSIYCPDCDDATDAPCGTTPGQCDHSTSGGRCDVCRRGGSD